MQTEPELTFADYKATDAFFFHVCKSTDLLNNGLNS